MASLERLTANRENARRSTGPRTRAGKRVSCQNGLKHGILAREVLLASERACDFMDLDRRLRAALRPADELEGLLVDRLVSCAWRLRRVLQAEAADLERARAAVLYPEDEDPFSESGENLDRMPRLTMRQLEDTVSWLQDEGDPFEDLDDEDDPLADAYTQLADRDFPEVLENDNGDNPGRRVRCHLRALGWTPERTREVLLEILTQEIRLRSKEMRAHARRVKKAKQVALRASLVPEACTLDRLLRYEAALERSFYRSLHELHRLQAARAGIPVPPPAALDVNVAVAEEP